MTCTIHTGRISIDDPNKLDITIMSADTIEGKTLAPTWDMVNALKGGTITVDQYREQYIKLLRTRWSKTPAPFEAILTRERVVLVCYCNLEGDETYCHRQTAAEILQKVGKAKGLDVVLAGEIKPPAKQLGLFTP